MGEIWARRFLAVGFFLLLISATETSAKALSDPQQKQNAAVCNPARSVAANPNSFVSSFVCDPTSHLSAVSAGNIDLVAKQLKDKGNTVGVALIADLSMLAGARASSAPKSSKESWHCSSSGTQVAREHLTSWKVDALILIGLNEKEFCVETRLGRFHFGDSDYADLVGSVQELLDLKLTSHAVIHTISVLKTSATHSTAVASLSPRDKYRVFIASMLPFIGFGIIDNGLMIIFGEIIEEFLGEMLGLSTMGSAATGNLASDVLGLMFGGSVQQMAIKMGAAEPPMTLAQRQLPSTIQWKVAGEAVGVTIGCWLGMAPLLIAPEKYGNKPEPPPVELRRDISTEGFKV